MENVRAVVVKWVRKIFAIYFPNFITDCNFQKDPFLNCVQSNENTFFF